MCICLLVYFRAVIAMVGFGFDSECNTENRDMPWLYASVCESMVYIVNARFDCTACGLSTAGK